MEDNKNKMTLCSKHNSKIESICYSCCELICSGCVRSHRQHIDHYDHISNIKSNLKNIYHRNNSNSDNKYEISGNDNSNNENSDNDNSNNKNRDDNIFKTRIEILWSSIQRRAEKINSLSSSEEKIKLIYRQFYNLIMAEELNVKKPIIDQSNELKQQFNSFIKEIKSLVFLSDINSISSSSEESSTAIDDRDEEQEISNPYQIETIIGFVNKSETKLETFIKLVRSSLFYFDKRNNTVEDFRNNGLEDDLILLNLLNAYNKEFKFTLSEICEKPKTDDFKIIEDNTHIEQFIKNIRQSVRVLTEEDISKEDFKKIDKLELTEKENELLDREKKLKILEEQQKVRENQLNSRELEQNIREENIIIDTKQLGELKNHLNIRKNLLNDRERQLNDKEKQLKDRENKVINKESQPNDKEKKLNDKEKQLIDKEKKPNKESTKYKREAIQLF